MTFHRHWATDIYQDSTGVLLVKHATFSIAAATSNSLVVAAVTGKNIRVLSMILGVATGGAMTGIKFKSASGGTALTDDIQVPVGSVILDPNHYGWCETTAGQGLYADTTAGSTVKGSIRYIEVTYP